MSDYKYAAKNKLRFPSLRGDLMVEQLFDLPLRSNVGFDLDNVAKTINAELKTMDQESFVEDTSANPRKAMLTVKLDIVKDVIKTKQEAEAARLNQLKKNDERKKILDAIAAQKDRQLSTATVEELEKQLKALDERS